VSIKDGPGEGTWSVFAMKVVEERDALREEVERLCQERERLSASLAEARAKAETYEKDWYAAKSEFGTAAAKLREQHREEVSLLRKEQERSTDWYQQRFNRLRRWVKEEVEPLSEEAAHRYFAICANGSPAPHESADWRETLHGLTLERDQARAKVRLITEEYKPGWVQGLEAVARSVGYDPDKLRHEGVEPPDFIQDVIEDLKRKVALHEDAYAVCEKLADWWHKHGIEGTAEIDDIAWQARGVVFKVKGPEEP
jgi:hypothetical protein